MLKVYTDGASRGNPGLAGAGVCITDSTGSELKKVKSFLGTLTNNIAEYKALLLSIDALSELSARGLKIESIIFYSDSLLMVRQISGRFKIKSAEISLLVSEFKDKVRKNKFKYTIEHIPRGENKVADKLANEAIDEREEQLTLKF